MRRYLQAIVFFGCLVPAFPQQVLDPGRTSTTIVRTSPLDGAANVALDRPSLIRFSAPLQRLSVGPTSVEATYDGNSLEVELTLSLNRRTLRVEYPTFLPDEAVVVVSVHGSLMRDIAGNRIDGDGDGMHGGTGVFQFTTGPGVGPPLETGSAQIMGYVFDADGAPLEGVNVDAVYYPGADNAPSLGGGVMTATDGQFTYTTPEFTGEGDFLVRIRAMDANGELTHSEALRRVIVQANRCWRVEDAFMVPLTPPVMVMASAGTSNLPGGVLTDPTGMIELEIPPGAMSRDSDIGITVVPDQRFLRDELPPLTIRTSLDSTGAPPVGTFISIEGVFGDETSEPVTLRLPNQFGLSPGTRVPMGKIDHNTLEWIDLRQAYDGPGNAPDEYLGTVTPDGSAIEIQFDHFCTICTPWCAPTGHGDGTTGGDAGHGDGDAGECDCCPSSAGPGLGVGTGNGPGAGGNSVAGSSVVQRSFGDLYEFVDLPSVQEFGRDVTLRLGYFSSSARPSVVISATVGYPTPRPVERTQFRFEIEGVAIEATYDFHPAGQRPTGTFLWDGRDVFGTLLPTGSYDYEIGISSLHADSASTHLAIPAIFGGPPQQFFPGIDYPGLTVLTAEPIEERAVLLNLQDSAYGAGWFLESEHRLALDPDGCVVIHTGAGRWSRFDPDPVTLNTWISAPGEFSLLRRNPESGEFLRQFDDGSEHVFSATGRLLKVHDRYGNQTTYDYDVTGEFLTQVTTPTGYWWTLAYDGAGKLSSITDSAGRSTGFFVDLAGDLVSVTDAAGGTRTFQYGSLGSGTEHLLVSQDAPRGERSEYDYANGRIVEARSYDTDGATLLRRRQFAPYVIQGEAGYALASGVGDGVLNPIPVTADREDTYIDGRGGVHVADVDGRGLVTRSSDPLGRTTLYEHTEDQVSARTRPDGSVTRYVYDGAGNLIAQEEYLDGIALYSTETHVYADAFGRLSRVIDAEGKNTLLHYDVFGSLSAIEDHSGNELEFRFDSIQFPALMTRSIAPTGDTVDFTYDPHGNLETTTDHPDPVGVPAGRTTVFEYDDAGNLTHEIDPDGRSTWFTYDVFNRTTSRMNDLAEVVSFDYFGSDCGCATPNLTTVTLQDLTTIQFAYDGLNRRISMVDQLGEVSTFSYDEEGSQLESADRNGEIVDYVYDAGGQLIQRLVPGRPPESFEYDDLGNLTKAADVICRVLFGYDSLSRRTTAQTVLTEELAGGAVEYEHLLTSQYDRVGNRTTVSDSENVADLTLGYNDLHGLEVLTEVGPAGRTWMFAYDAAGRPQSITRPGTSITTTMSYDLAEQVTAIGHSSSPPIQLDYSQYDGAGNLVAAVTTQPAGVVTSTYAYDGAKRLASASSVPALGDVRVDRTYVHDAANRILSDNEYVYVHDKEGRLVSRTSPGLSEAFTYTALGQLIEFTQDDTSQGAPVRVLTSTYQYDPLGRRVGKSVNGVVTGYVHDGPNVLHELDGQNRLNGTWTHGGGVDRALGWRDAVTGELVALLTDRLGSVVGTVAAQGAQVSSFVYDDYGALLDGFDDLGVLSLGSPPAFSGRELDLESGLYFHRARVHEPSLGRFLGEDAIGRDEGRNLFPYAGSNPINLIDPFGDQEEPPVDCAIRCRRLVHQNPRGQCGFLGQIFDGLRYLNCLRVCRNRNNENGGR